MRVLIIEDEVRLAANLAAGLREAGFAVDHAADGQDGLACASQNVFDLIILDLMLPGRDGKSILKAIRSKRIDTPVLILTAVDTKTSTVDLLNAGADDYLPKPFEFGELIARAKALIRRSKGTSSPILRVPDLSIDTIHQTVLREGKEIVLSPTEYRILEFLAHRPMAVISKKQLLEHLYDYAWEHHSNVIEAHVSNLRRKIMRPGSEPLIETLRHRGYRLRSEER